MDWEKKFNSIIRDTDANLEKVKSRVLLSQRTAAAAGSSDSSSAVSPVPASATELHATLQKHAAELRRLAGVQRRHELENEYVRAELLRLRRDVKRLTGSSSRHASDPARAAPAPAAPPATQRGAGPAAPKVDSEALLRRIASLEERVASLQEQRQQTPPRSLGSLGTSPLTCVDDHFPAETGDVTPTENGRLAEPLGFNLDDLALSDSDDH